MNVKQNKKERRTRRLHAIWEKKKDRAKTLWVVAVLAFWISVAILGVVYYLEARLDLMLVSIALGLMVLGVWLKARYQVILRKEPERPESPDGLEDVEDNQSGG